MRMVAEQMALPQMASLEMALPDMDPPPSTSSSASTSAPPSSTNHPPQTHLSLVAASTPPTFRPRLLHPHLKRALDSAADTLELPYPFADLSINSIIRCRRCSTTVPTVITAIATTAVALRANPHDRFTSTHHRRAEIAAAFPADRGTPVLPS